MAAEPTPPGMAGREGFDEACSLRQFSKSCQGTGLVKCAMGFASGVTGGMAGSMYVVTDPSDEPNNPVPGTLRYGVMQASSSGSGGVWITFSRPMTIRLKDKLWLQSDTTIDGREHKVTITSHAIVLRAVSNIIVHNIEVRDIKGDSDALHIRGGANKVWVDHCSFTGGARGLTTAIDGATDITFSNNRYLHNFFVMLLGGCDTDEQDREMRVTVFRNYFQNCNQRMPHIRFGRAHVVNNCYSNWEYYCLGGRVQGSICSEKNVFNAGPERKEVTPWWPGFDNSPGADCSPTILSSGDAFFNGATMHEFKNSAMFSVPYSLEVMDTSNLWNFVTTYAGPIAPPPKLKPPESR